MADEDLIDAVVEWLAEMRVCPQCATRIRFGDYECPHCGADLEEALREWAGRLIAEVRSGEG